MNISWVTLRVKNLAASKQFYGALLGMEQSRAFGEPDGPQFVFYTDGNGTEVELIEGMEPVVDLSLKGMPVSLGFKTSAYDEILEKAKAGGMEIRGPVALKGPLVLGGRLECFFLEDPDGFCVQVMRE